MTTSRGIVLLAAVLTLASLAQAQQTPEISTPPEAIPDGPVTNSAPVPQTTGGLPAWCYNTRPPDMYFSADAMLLNLSGPDDRALVLNQDTDEVLLRTSDIDYQLEVAPRVTIGTNDDEWTAYEATYFNLRDREEALVEGDDDLILPGDLPWDTFDFRDADIMHARTFADVHNFELNVVRKLRSPELALIYGLRYVEFDEHFNLRSLNLDSGMSDYNIHADNRLWGGQMGLRWRREMRRVGVEVVGKGGAFNNDAEQRTALADESNTVVLRYDRTNTDEIAFVGEFGFTGYCRLGEVWYLRGGYSFTMIAGVGRAADQLDFTTLPGAGIGFRTGEAFLHGSHFGLEARW